MLVDIFFFRYTSYTVSYFRKFVCFYHNNRSLVSDNGKNPNLMKNNLTNPKLSDILYLCSGNECEKSPEHEVVEIGIFLFGIGYSEKIIRFCGRIIFSSRIVHICIKVNKKISCLFGSVANQLKVGNGLCQKKILIKEAIIVS